MVHFIVSLVFALCLAQHWASAQRPNILLILTDDQDVLLDGMLPMRSTQQLIAEAGVTFTNAFTSSPICCPSRASLLSGLYAHNHRTRNNSASGGCYGGTWRREIEPHALPFMLQAYGDYRTFYAGKYLNQYRGDRVPPGWFEFHGLLGNSRYYNYTLRENQRNVSYGNEYLTDVLRDLTLAFLQKHTSDNEEAADEDRRPFFAMVAPPAPHAPYTPAERHRGRFADVEALRTPNFNHLSGPLEKHWLVAASESISNDTLQLMDEYFQQRWEALLAVDELVGDIIERLDELEELNNTYVVYTSDNGYHVGQFAQPFDKRQPYETDIRVPLLMRGPAIPAGVKIAAPALLLDLMPTMLQWANIEAKPHKPFDGVSLQPLLEKAHELSNGTEELESVAVRANLLVEYWGEGSASTYNPACPWSAADRLAECTPEADCHCQDAWNNTYACIRELQRGANRLYCEFRDEEHFVEAYDLDTDPYQLHNCGYEWLPIERALYSLNLEKLMRCSGTECHQVKS